MNMPAANSHFDWMETNNQHLSATIEWIHIRLQLAIENKSNSPLKETLDLLLTKQEKILSKITSLEKNEAPPALILLSNQLGLTTFEKNIVALCAAIALNSHTAVLCAQAHNNNVLIHPTFELAFNIFEQSEWSAVSPHWPLRYFQLLEIHQTNSQTLTNAAISLDEHIVNYLKGINNLDDRLTSFIRPINNINHEFKGTTHEKIVQKILNHIQHTYGETTKTPVIELTGQDIKSKRSIATKVSQSLGLHLHAIDLKAVPNQTNDFETFIRIWQRESRLMPLALSSDNESTSDSEKVLLTRLIDRTNTIHFLFIEEPTPNSIENTFSIEVNKPTPEEQLHIWQTLLPDNQKNQSHILAEQFSFNHNDIYQLSKTTDNLWQACRLFSRAKMEKLASRIEVKASWDLLVLPPEQKSLLRQIIDQVSCRNTVYDDWGFRIKMNRGLGINALFSGGSGTGKTMAAEVIANELDLDLYRIDLSAVVSKYIGETEKNLRKLFDAAEDSGAILFFDEADALFGKRSEVKDSHDRYANIEINYLLQRLESYRGLAILATNMKNSMDKAFIRRLRFMIDFPFPGVQERMNIWQKVFPQQTPLEKNIDYQRLAKLNLSGGNIHSIALNAAFLTAQKSAAVSMESILTAARDEFKKLELPAKESDFIWQKRQGQRHEY